MVCWRVSCWCWGVKEPWRNHGSEIFRRDFCGLPLAMSTTGLDTTHFTHYTTSALATWWEPAFTYDTYLILGRHMNKDKFSLLLSSSGRGGNLIKNAIKNSHNTEIKTGLQRGISSGLRSHHRHVVIHSRLTSALWDICTCRAVPGSQAN
jgi:hypothetical protein